MADADTLIDEVLKRAERKKKRLDANRPIPADLARRLSENIRIRYSYHSNAIEGNTLTLRETKVVIEEGITVRGKPLKDHLEAVNSAQAYDLIETLAKGSEDIDHATIQQLHEILMHGILLKPGKCRTKNVRITGAVKSPPDFSKVINLMDKLVEKIRRNESHPVFMAAYIHHRFVEIHPFIDGNGRMARLLTNLYLIRHGYPPIILKKEDREKYYECLRKADEGNIKPFVHLIANGVDEALLYQLSVFGGVDELLPLKVIAHDSPYSQEYLSLRARQGKLDATKIDGVWHSTRRALKDYTDSMA